MLELLSSGLIGLWLQSGAAKPPAIDPAWLFQWQGIPIWSAQKSPDPAAQTRLSGYLKTLSGKGISQTQQGIWLQSGPALLVEHQGMIPRSAASLTKIATTLAALETWGPQKQFETQVAATGPIQNGVLQGDLVIRGSGDPFFVWEEAIALGNALQQRGIRRVTGRLVIVGDFYMNYQRNPLIAGQFLQQGLNAQRWPATARAQYNRMAKGTSLPQVEIAQGVQVATLPNPKQYLVVRHFSLPLSQILKEMNVYSNNEMSEMLAKSLGGAQQVAVKASQGAGVPLEEIQLINGSGLGVENRISPRAVIAMFMTIQRQIQPHQLTLADLFPVSGRDRRGTMKTRNIPTGTIIKTGTLNQVSALAGVMPSRDRGLIWFTIINNGGGFEQFRRDQDQFLQQLSRNWGVANPVPAAIVPRSTVIDPAQLLGDPRRNQIITDVQIPL